MGLAAGMLERDCGMAVVARSDDGVEDAGPIIKGCGDAEGCRLSNGSLIDVGGMGESAGGVGGVAERRSNDDESVFETLLLYLRSGWGKIDKRSENVTAATY